MVRAKFKVEEIAHRKESANILLSPVTSGSEENKSFYKWTPNGEIKLTTINPDAVKHFEVGKEYYVDFIEA